MPRTPKKTNLIQSRQRREGGRQDKRLVLHSATPPGGFPQTSQTGHRHTEPHLPACSTVREVEGRQKPADLHATHRPVLQHKAQTGCPTSACHHTKQHKRMSRQSVGSLQQESPQCVTTGWPDEREREEDHNEHYGER